MSPTNIAHPYCSKPFTPNTSARRVCEVVCNVYASSPPGIEHSTDRRTALYFRVLLDTDSHPTLTLYGSDTTHQQVQNLRLIISSGHRHWACVSKAVCCFGLVSGGCVDDTVVCYRVSTVRGQQNQAQSSMRQRVFVILGTAVTKFNSESSL